MRSVRVPAVLLVGLGIAWAVSYPIEVAANRGVVRIALEDDCDTTDTAWDNAGVEGCELKHGTVTRAEFNLFSVLTPGTGTPPGPPTAPAGTPLAAAVIGHPSWRFDPGYVAIEAGQRLRVKNEGGRGHTFTEVASFGGGFIPPLRFGLTPAPNCLAIAADPTQVLAPGSRIDVSELTPGNHQFMCCIHSWMRTLVKVEAKD
jgi:plastocyanin